MTASAGDDTPNGNRRAAEDVIDEALRLLGDQGFAAQDPEARDLLESAAISRNGEERFRLRSHGLRETLGQLPSAFNLFDREGTKLYTIAGGEDVAGSSPVFATLTHAEATLPERDSQPREISVQELQGIVGALAELGGFGILGNAVHPSGLPGSLAEMYRLYLGILASNRPHLVRPHHPESSDGIRHLLAALRGSTSAARQKPLAILEAVAQQPLEWSPVACRILIDGARQGIPITPVLPPPQRGADPWRWLIESTASGIAGITIHHLAAAHMPILWGIPLIPLGTLPPDWTAAWSLSFRVADLLGIPTVATVSTAGSRAPTETIPADACPTAACQAVICGARIVAFGGFTSEHPHAMSIPQLQRDHTLLPELERMGRLARFGRAAAARFAMRAATHAAARSAPPDGLQPLAAEPVPIQAELHERLTQVITNEAARHGVSNLPLGGATSS